VHAGSVAPETAAASSVSVLILAREQLLLGPYLNDGDLGCREHSAEGPFGLRGNTRTVSNRQGCRERARGCLGCRHICRERRGEEGREHTFVQYGQ